MTEITMRRRAVLDHVIARAAGRALERLDGEVLTSIRIGAYALLYLDRIPDHAAVDTAVALLKEEGWARAAGFAAPFSADGDAHVGIWMDRGPDTRLIADIATRLDAALATGRFDQFLGLPETR